MYLTYYISPILISSQANTLDSIRILGPSPTCTKKA